MATKDAFEKIHIDDSQKKDLSGVLEQLNLPPVVVNYVRENKTLVQTALIVLILAVVVWALYDSYHEKQVEKASTELAIAMDADDDSIIAALDQVSEDFNGTTSGLWARINAANTLVDQGKAEEAVARYLAINSEVDEKSPVKPLIILALGQAYELTGDAEQARIQYESLKSFIGYESLAYSGLARSYESTGEKLKALETYEEYSAMLNDGTSSGNKALIEEKITRIKASL